MRLLLRKLGGIGCFAYCILCPNFLSSQTGSPVVTDTSLISDHGARFDNAMISGNFSANWSREYLVQRDSDLRGFSIYDRSGNLASDVKLKLKDAQIVSLASATITPSGGMIAAGVAQNADGGIANFIAKTDLSGVPLQIIRTNPFDALLLCSTSDEIWALGYDLDKEDARPKQDYNVLKRYSLKKGEIDSFLPRMSFHSGPPPVRGINELQLQQSRRLHSCFE